MATAVKPKPPPPNGAVHSLTVGSTVTGHRRGDARFWSVRNQLLAPILVAMLGLGVLGSVQTVEAIGNARDAHRARVVATTATVTVRLTHELEREMAETVALRQRGGHAGEQLVVAQRGRSNQALMRYRQAMVAAARDAPALNGRLRAADAQLDLLADARSQGDSGGRSDQVFHDIVDALLAVADALPSQLRDQDLASAARAVAALAAVEHYHALERDLLRTIFARGSVQGGERIELAKLDAARQQREAEFARVATPSARKRYDSTVAGPDIQKAAQLRETVFASDAAAVKADADGWYVVQSSTVRKVNLVGLSLSDELDRLAANVSASATRRAWLTALGTAGIGLVALITALLLAVWTSRRLNRLRVAALTVAQHELPHTIRKVLAGESPDRTVGRGSSAAETTRHVAASDDEVGQLADAFSSVHRAALRLAGDQAELHIDVARMAEIFARRIRTLVTRQLRLLDEFEREETDPEALSRLFALDHLAARLRRNGENLLVLAGGEPNREVTAAYPLAAIVKASASEIEDFHRVETQGMDVAVVGPVVGDLVHLLAELLENAAAFSPPTAAVRVDARQTVDGVLLRVHDSGIGLAEARLAEVNARLARRTPTLSSAAAGTMGLYVVAHLAARHGIKVQLHATAAGTVAYVLLPLSIIAPMTAVTPARGPLLRPAAVAPVQAGMGERGRLVPNAQPTVWFRPQPCTAGEKPNHANPPAVGFSPVGGGAVGDTLMSGGAGGGTLMSGGAGGGTLMSGPAVDGNGSLPRRSPGAQMAGDTEGPPAPVWAAPPDPEAVRARLSALAEGVSAALRGSNQPATMTKDR